MISTVAKAARFAEKMHDGSYRKFSGLPYFVHPMSVATTVARVSRNKNMLAAAYLHDVVEDTPVTIWEIMSLFGRDVGLLVSELTDVSRKGDGPRSHRKAIDRWHLSKASCEAKTIKLADMIDNMPDMIENNPKFAEIYMAEKRELLKVLVEGDSRLYLEAKAIIDNYYNPAGLSLAA